MKLRRITTHGNWIPEIDGLRFVAIAATILIHIFNDTHYHFGALSTHGEWLADALSQRGRRGVPLFFAISGFILAQPFLRQHLLHGSPVSIKGFFKRRLTRLEPPYILSLLIYAVAEIIAHRAPGPRDTALSFLAHVFYVHNFVALPAINFVTWSLEVEVQFYILAPVLGLMYLIRSAPGRRLLMCGLIVASLAVRQFFPGQMGGNLPGMLCYFLVGFLLADLRATRTHSQVHRWWDLVGLAAWCAIFGLSDSQLERIFPLCILCAYLAAFYGPVSRAIFRTEWIALTGGMCYSFYLMHVLVLSTGLRLTDRFLVRSSFGLSVLIQMVLLLPPMFVLCTAYFVLVERPCMDPAWPHKLKLHVCRLLHSGADKSIESR